MGSMIHPEATKEWPGLISPPTLEPGFDVTVSEPERFFNEPGTDNGSLEDAAVEWAHTERGSSSTSPRTADAGGAGGDKHHISEGLVEPDAPGKSLEVRAKGGHPYIESVKPAHIYARIWGKPHPTETMR